MRERDKVAQALRSLAEIYGRKLSDSAIELMTKMWEPYDYSRLDIAIRKTAETCDFMPTIHQLKDSVSHLCPTKLAQQVMLRWQKSGGVGIPTQEEIDSILVSLDKNPGEVQRKLLLPKG